MLVDKNKSISLHWDLKLFVFQMKQKCFIIHQYGSVVVTWLQSKINAVPCKVSSCGVYEVSRQGIEWLGNSFGCMKVAMKIAWGLAHNSQGKSSHQ